MIELEFKSKLQNIVGKSLCEIFRGTLAELLKTKIKNRDIESNCQKLAIECLENYMMACEGGNFTATSSQLSNSI